MRATLLLALLLTACPHPDSDGTTVTGELGGESFDPTTVAFDVYGAGPEDSADPERDQYMVVFADSADLCPLLGPLFHYWWLRCESTCSGLYANQEAWPSGEVRMVWVGFTVDEDVEDVYTLASRDGPGSFTADYRPVDLSALAELDQQGCFDACTADYTFLLGDSGAASVGDLEISSVGSNRLEGDLDLLFSQGEIEARFTAEQCDMGLHGP